MGLYSILTWSLPESGVKTQRGKIIWEAATFSFSFPNTLPIGQQTFCSTTILFDPLETTF